MAKQEAEQLGNAEHDRVEDSEYDLRIDEIGDQRGKNRVKVDHRHREGKKDSVPDKNCVGHHVFSM